MAEFHFSGIDELCLSLKEIEEIPEEIVDEMLSAQADVLVTEIRRRGKGYGVDDTGKMLKSIKIGKPKRGKSGSRQLIVSPRGSRKRGNTSTKNAEIAFLTNYGTRHQPARPFWSDAELLSEKSMEAAGLEVYNGYLLSNDL